MQKTILYAVLNWGLGHASRSIPIIRYLLKQNYKVIIASDGAALQLLQKEFPNVLSIQAPSYNIFYSKTKAFFYVNLLNQLPSLKKTISNEHIFSEKIIKQYNVDIIISDNRYGFYSKNIPCFLICHQLHLLLPKNISFLSSIINFFYTKQLNKFNAVWVPDFIPPNSISGKMSQSVLKKIHFIGIESHFKKIKKLNENFFLAILSGPEPQRSIFEGLILKLFKNTSLPLVLVRGTNQAKLNYKPSKNIKVYGLLSSNELQKHVSKAKAIICRSGYSSIIDLLSTQKLALLIPTPGQLEQEYLCNRMKEKNYFATSTQDKLCIADLDKIFYTKLPKTIIKYNYQLIQQFLAC